MKHKKLLVAILALAPMFLGSCGSQSSQGTNDSVVTNSSKSNITSNSTVIETISSGEVSEDTSAISNDGSGVDLSIFSSVEIDSSFTINTSTGSYTKNGNIYTITSGGTYILEGNLEGQIYVAAGENDEVELDLEGVYICYSENSPIFVESADKVKIKAKKDTYNEIVDLRALETTEDTSQGGGAIYAKSDLNLIGQGTLVVTGSYNNGIQTTKDLKIKKQNLKVTAPNNAIRGKDSISITSGTILAISTNGDGLKSAASDISSKGNQKGSINISGGNVTIYSAYDGIDAAYDANIYNGIDEDDLVTTTVPTVTIYTNIYSNYTSTNSINNYDVTSPFAFGGPGGPGGGGGFGPGGQDEGNTDKSELSAEGIKAANTINIIGGSIFVKAYDDAIHANYGTVLENSAIGVGDVNITGGNMTLYASDDGLHADRYLNIGGGEITIAESYEAIEGYQILVSGGKTIAYSSDDAVNASAAPVSTLTDSPIVKVTGGYLFAAVPSNGDTDGIDSNGDYYQDGGVVIACGPSSNNASSLDIDERGSATLNGGTLITFGKAAANFSRSSSISYSTKTGSFSNKIYNLIYSNGDSVETAKLLSSTYSVVYSYSDKGTLSSIS